MTKLVRGLVALLLIVASASIPAQSDLDSVTTGDEPTVEQRLLSLQQTLGEKEKERNSLRRELKLEKDDVTKEQLQQELLAAEDIILGVREEIVSLATGGVKLFAEQPVVDTEFNWEKDLERIFEPILEQLREISERPQLIEKLESDINYWEKREETLFIAVDNLNQNLESVNSGQLKKELTSLRETANSRLNSAQQKLQLLRSELSTLKQSDNPIWSIINEIFSDVIIDMIIHFFIAAFAAFLTYQMLKLIAALLIRIVRSVKPKDEGLADRTINIARVVLGSIISFIIYFVVLYSLAEWFLLVFSLLIAAGLILGLKDAIPAYLVEIKTLLNMGTIRQGERFMFNGLPWKISRLNVHTHLHNPLLHGHLRVSLSEIVNDSSRPYHKDEPWFPTTVGDYVFLNDQVFGKVIRQTPEIVEVDVGDSIFTYQTTSFLSSGPRNLSRQGFTIYEIFGFDYQHQQVATSSMLSAYQVAIKKAIDAQPFGQYSTYLDVEFHQASASSLDYKILARFSGEAASDYFKIRRLLQKASVDFANTNGWVIPFEQLTVHHQPAD